MQSGYGLDGLRAWATAGGNTNYFLYDNDTPVVGITSAGVVTRVNTFGANGLLASYSQNFTGGSYERYYAFDPQGNTSEMIAGTGSSGTLLLSATYDSFGKRSVYPTTYDGDIYDSFGAQWGYRVDAGTGFELLGHRFFDEANGRFVNRDPIGYDGGIDLYEYGNDEPQTDGDPTGFGFYGKAQCAALLVRLTKAIERYERDLRNLAKHGCNDKGHDKSLNEAKREVDDLMKQYNKFCSGKGNQSAPAIPALPSPEPNPTPNPEPSPGAPIIINPGPTPIRPPSFPGGAKIDIPGIKIDFPFDPILVPG